MSRPLTRQLVLETKVRIPDGAGGFVDDWQTLGTVWADMQAGTGREVAGEASGVSELAWRITLRGAPMGDAKRPQAGQRLREGLRVFQIIAVAEAAASGAFLTCFATEEVRP